ncbi:prepilin-type N-terminal cleavage/methylation domain-containing protein [Myxococcus sp. K15C18031901]|uniref:PilW family protein n=1 Tax=Myxococcus dinghuensis TaxID=2906761 RepID=UPI0020A7DD83|nr:prepilin-type N-terminal cleavage/methylation domain-containing protein [Myxococcus dinghuensis]MCP3102472.1 prepilin-type N-terminal cleavage/methylation domain-containing protein [Myxococcus dinghuensis]
MRPVPGRARRGFTLLEMMIAVGLGLVVLTTGLVVGARFQRTSSFEEQAMATQNLQRAVTETLSLDLQRAGSGIGNGRILFGGDGSGGYDYRYGVEVRSNATFSDPGFSGPTGPYAGLTSDALLLTRGSTRDMLPLDECVGAGGSARVGSEACLFREPPASFNGRQVVFTNPSVEVACVHTITGLPGGFRVTTSEGVGGPPAPSGSACDALGGSFWKARRGYVMGLETWGYRVNWRDGGKTPVLEYDPPGPDGWTLLSRDVEQLTVRLGVENPAAPGALLWFPDGPTGRPSLDTCDNTRCDAHVAAVGGYTAKDLPDGDPKRARDALMRRVRMLEVTVVSRSQRVDAERIVVQGAGFKPDEEENPLDGHRRRHTTFRISPRNFRIAGVGTP